MILAEANRLGYRGIVARDAGAGGMVVIAYHSYHALPIGFCDDLAQAFQRRGQALSLLVCGESADIDVAPGQWSVAILYGFPAGHPLRPRLRDAGVRLLEVNAPGVSGVRIDFDERQGMELLLGQFRHVQRRWPLFLHPYDRPWSWEKRCSRTHAESTPVTNMVT